jgi:pimeloyl-ACP methyl ester carboxylesterase
VSATPPPVVLIHGWGGSTRATWGPMAWPQALESRGRRAIPVDLLGHGEAATPHDTEAYASLVDAAGEHFADEHLVDAVAYSLGAKVLLQLVAREPQRFRKIVLIGIGERALHAEPVATAVGSAMRNGITAETPAAVLPYVVYGLASGNDRYALAACIERPWTPVDPARLSAFEGSVLLAVGEQDTFIGDPQPLLDSFTDSRLVRLPGADHLGTPYAAGLQAHALNFLGASASN